MALWKKIGWALKEKNEAFLSIVCTGDRNFLRWVDIHLNIDLYIYWDDGHFYLDCLCTLIGSQYRFILP